MPGQATSLGLALPAELVRQVETRAGLVLDDFVPVAAVVCDAELAPFVSAQLTSTFAEDRHVGDFTRAVERLNAPSEGMRLDQDSCPVASFAPLPDLWLIDEHGRALRPSYPVDDCGSQRIGGLVEVEALPVTKSVTHTVDVQPFQLQEWMNCGTSPVVPVAGDRALEPDRYSLGGAVCRYADSNTETTRFTGAEWLHDSLEDDFDALMPAPECRTAASAVANSSISFYDSSMPQPVYIELDGCRRVLIAGHRPLSASAEVIAHFA